MAGKGLLGGPGSRSVDGTRQWIALFTVLLSVVGIVVVAIVALVAADSASRPDTARLIFTSMLPLFGTWVGTVLAFYFVRENLEAATESTLRLSGAFSSSDLVTKAMIPLAASRPGSSSRATTRTPSRSTTSMRRCRGRAGSGSRYSSTRTP